MAEDNNIDEQKKAYQEALEKIVAWKAAPEGGPVRKALESKIRELIGANPVILDMHEENKPEETLKAALADAGISYAEPQMATEEIDADLANAAEEAQSANVSTEEEPLDTGNVTKSENGIKVTGDGTQGSGPRAQEPKGEWDEWLHPISIKLIEQRIQTEAKMSPKAILQTQVKADSLEEAMDALKDKLSELGISDNAMVHYFLEPELIEEQLKEIIKAEHPREIKAELAEFLKDIGDNEKEEKTKEFFQSKHKEQYEASLSETFQLRHLTNDGNGLYTLRFVDPRAIPAYVGKLPDDAMSDEAMANNQVTLDEKCNKDCLGWQYKNVFRIVQNAKNTPPLYNIQFTSNQYFGDLKEHIIGIDIVNLGQDSNKEPVFQGLIDFGKYGRVTMEHGTAKSAGKSDQEIAGLISWARGAGYDSYTLDAKGESLIKAANAFIINDLELNEKTEEKVLAAANKGLDDNKKFKDFAAYKAHVLSSPKSPQQQPEPMVG